MNTTCFPNGIHLIMAGYGNGSIGDPYLLGVAVSGVSGNDITTVSPHYSIQSTVANPDVVNFTTTGTLPTPLAVGSQWFWQAYGGSTSTVTQAQNATDIILTTSAAHGASSGTRVYVRNLGYTNQSTGVNGCDGLYAADSGTSGTTINLAINYLGTCPNGTITSVSAANPGTFTLSGTLPGVGDYIIISGLSGGSWASLNGAVLGIKSVSGSTITVGAGNVNSPALDTTGYGTETGSPTFAPDIVNTTNLEVVVNPYFTNYIGTTGVSSDLSVSATNGGSPISLSGGSGTHTIWQRIRSPYWGGLNSNGNVSAMHDYVVYGGPAIITKQVTFSNGSSPMEIRPPSWEYHGWPGKTGDTLGAIIENTDLSSSACGGRCSYAVDSRRHGDRRYSLSGSTIIYGPTSRLVESIRAYRMGYRNHYLYHLLGRRHQRNGLHRRRPGFRARISRTGQRAEPLSIVSWLAVPAPVTPSTHRVFKSRPQMRLLEFRSSSKATSTT